MKKKIIGVTYDIKEDWEFRSNDLKDANAEFDPARVVNLVIEAVEKSGYEVKRIGNVTKLIEQLNHLEVDIVLNLCEGISGRNRESQVPILLEMKDIPFVGADALTLGMTLDKAVAKKIFQAEGIPTPRYYVAKSLKDLDSMPSMKFPLIAKTVHEGSSKGISEKSRVDDILALKRQVELINNTYQQPALIEEFIRGQEFTVAVLGNGNCQAMPVVQTMMDGEAMLGDKFYTFDRIFNDTVKYVCSNKKLSRWMPLLYL